VLARCIASQGNSRPDTASRSAAPALRSMSEAGFYHCSVKPVGRANGRSIVAAAAYRSGQRLEDERTGETFDFRARGGVEDSFIITPDGAAAWGKDRARLWNEAERAEPRANGRLATELELALPCELNAAQRRELVADFVRGIVDRYGVAADVAIHAPGKNGDHRNHHAHVLITHRELGPESFGDIAHTRTVTRKRKGREVQEQVAGIAATPADVKAIRKAWEQDVNRAYEGAGLDIRVDHRSHADRGIEADPTKHNGPSASGMERRGEASDRGDVNREITARNAERQRLAELAAEAAAIKVEIASELAARDAERLLAAAARRTTEPAAPIFDRDQAERDWQEKLEAAAIAKDASATTQESRQQPETAAAATDTLAPATEPLQPPEVAASAAIEDAPAASSEMRPADRVAGGILGHLAKVMETLGGLLFGFGLAEPKQTAQQRRDEAQAAGNIEDRHAREAASVARADEFAREWQAHDFKTAQQEKDVRLAQMLGTNPTAEANLGRDEYDRQRGQERERER
jgi:hypothetical protein